MRFFDVDVIGQTGQFALSSVPSSAVYNIYGSAEVTATPENGGIAFSYTKTARTTVLEVIGILICLLDQKSAWEFWAPSTSADPSVQPDQQIFVIGPYLIRSAYVSHGVVHISGDNDNVTTIEVYAGVSDIETIDWNGIRLDAVATPCGSVAAQIPGAQDQNVSLPLLVNWRSSDSLLEKFHSYDDSKRAVCNKTTTLSPMAPLTVRLIFF
jgi:beta-galactosidase